MVGALFRFYTIFFAISPAVVFDVFLFRKMEEERINCYRVCKDQGKAKGLLFACMHYRAHPRHYRAEYVRGYLHRKRCV